MVISPNDYANHFETVYNHEAVHIRQLHSIDILLVELLKIIFWFNPGIWLYKMALKETHEFLADEIARNKDEYATFLLSYAKHAPIRTISNQFFSSSLLKERIYMIYTNRSPQWMRGKYFLAVPLIVCMTLLFSVQAENVILPQKPASNLTKTEPLSPPVNTIVELKENVADLKNSVKAPTLLQEDGTSKASSNDSLPSITDSISELKQALAQDDLGKANRLLGETNRMIMNEKRRLFFQETELNLRTEAFRIQKEHVKSEVVIELANRVMAFSENALKSALASLKAMENEYDHIYRELRRKSDAQRAAKSKATQQEIINDLTNEGIVSDTNSISYRLHNMFMIVNGVEQPESVHQRYKAKYLQYTWIEWVYNWEGVSGHRVNGVRYDGK
ncbi:M56 family metallopeptidase [Arundinibacter roseus]|nr:M56 family metallopeptidase [Arundinibacter roseus]